MVTAVETRPLSYEEEHGKPVPSQNHGRVQVNLIVELAQQQPFSIYSELKLTLAGVNYMPDISVYPRESVDFRHDKSSRGDPPLTTVEILSASQSDQEFVDRAEIYLAEGVKSCWVVSPPLRTITILMPDGRQEVFSRGVLTDPVTGLTANLSRVFS